MTKKTATKCSYCGNELDEEEAASPQLVGDNKPICDDCYHEHTDPAELDRIGLVFGLLASYCRRKAMAMQCRLQGKIVAALHNEKTCEAIYAELPDWAKTREMT